MGRMVNAECSRSNVKGKTAEDKGLIRTQSADDQQQPVRDLSHLRDHQTPPFI